MNLYQKIEKLKNSSLNVKEIYLKINPSLVLRDIDYCIFNPKKFKMYKFNADTYKIIKEIELSNNNLNEVIKKFNIKNEDEDKFILFLEFIILKDIFQINIQ